MMMFEKSVRVLSTISTFLYTPSSVPMHHFLFYQTQTGIFSHNFFFLSLLIKYIKITYEELYYYYDSYIY